MVTFLTGEITQVPYDEGISRWSAQRNRYKKHLTPLENGTHLFAATGESCCTGASCLVVATTQEPHLVIKGCVACVSGEKNRICLFCVADPKLLVEDCCVANLCAFYGTLPPDYKLAQAVHNANKAHAKAVEELTRAAIATKNNALWNESVWLKAQADRISSALRNGPPKHQVNTHKDAGSSSSNSSGAHPPTPYSPSAPVPNWGNNNPTWANSNAHNHNQPAGMANWNNSGTPAQPWHSSGGNGAGGNPKGPNKCRNKNKYKGPQGGKKTSNCGNANGNYPNMNQGVQNANKKSNKGKGNGPPSTPLFFPPE